MCEHGDPRAACNTREVRHRCRIRLRVMRILALETNIGVIKERFIVHGEEELLTASHHWCYFLVFFFRGLVIFAVAGAGLWFMWLEEFFSNAWFVGFAALWLLLGAFLACNAYIRWRLNCIIVTTQKIIRVTQISFFHNDITPISFDNIASTRAESQFWGFVNVGVLHINLKERLQASNKEVTMKYMPHPSEIASVIENTIVMVKEHEEGERKEQIEEIKEKATTLPASAVPPGAEPTAEH